MMEMDNAHSQLINGVNSSLGYVLQNQQLFETEYMFALKHFGNLQ